MRRSALAVVTLTAVLAVAACAPDSAERGPLVPTEPSLAAGDLCAGGLASDIAKQQKALFSGAALNDLQAQFAVIKNQCPNAQPQMMTYLDAMLGYYGAPTTALRAGQVAAHLASVTLYVTATAVVRPSTVFMNPGGGAAVLSPGEFMTTYDQGARLAIADSTVPGGPHLFTFEQKLTSDCDGTTSLNVTRNGASLQGNGTGCYDVKDYPHETSYTPRATITLCMLHGDEAEDEIGLIHQRAGLGSEVLVDADASHSCSTFHASTDSWLRRGGPLGRVLASAYDYLRPQSLIADDVGESGSIGSFSLVGGALNVVFEDDFTDLVSPPDIGDTWTISATSPGYIQLQNGIADLPGSVVVLSQGQGACSNCPVFTLLGTRVNSASPLDTVGTYDVTWQSVQTKPNVKEAPFVVLNEAGAEIARLSYVTESSVNKLLFTAGGVTSNVGTWIQNLHQDFKITVSLTAQAPAVSRSVSLSINGTEVVTNASAPNARTLKQIGYLLTGIDAGIIGADNFKVLRLSDGPPNP